MPIHPKDGKLLYHITAFENLESIFQFGLLPRNSINFGFNDVADEEILGKRDKYDLGDYTPFHFFSPTPFAGAVQSSYKASEFVYITITRRIAEHNKFKIIPSHPLHFKGDPLEWSEGIDQINWDLIEERDYRNHDCSQACMAESIFKGKIRAKHFSRIFVRNQEVLLKVVDLVKKNNLTISVSVNPYMFKYR